MFDYIERMRNGESEANESWEHEERIDRDMEREPFDVPEPVAVHEDGHEKAVMVGTFYDEAMVDEWEAEADLARMGQLGEG